MTDWTAFGAVATGAGAIVTGISAGFVAWQAWETRKTARAGREAVAVGREGVVVAQDTLNLSRDSQEAAADGVEIGQRSLVISRRMAIDSTKARLDARAPRLHVLAVAPQQVVRATSLTGGEAQPWPVETELRRTRDDGTLLELGTSFRVANEGDRTVLVRVSGDVRPNEAMSFRPVDGELHQQLVPGQVSSFYLYARRSLAQWAELWESRAQGSYDGACTRGYVICSDPYDEGVIDRWNVEIHAYAVEAKPRDMGAWLVRTGKVDPPAVRPFVHPQQRDYFISKIGNLPLEEQDSS